MNVRDKMHLKEVLLQEKKMYLEQVGNYQKRLKIWKSHPDYFAWKYVRRMRITSYYYSRRKQNPMCSLLYIGSCRLMNQLGRKLGIESGENVFDSGVRIFHTQGIVINGNARVGKNCYLYGNNCIGNDGINRECPTIGDNVRLCVGAKVLGG